ncbi:MAG: hypothetical protein ACK4K9_10035 [Bacteroidia bacterium]
MTPLQTPKNAIIKIVDTANGKTCFHKVLSCSEAQSVDVFEKFISHFKASEIASNNRFHIHRYWQHYLRATVYLNQLNEKDISSFFKDY